MVAIIRNSNDNSIRNNSFVKRNEKLKEKMKKKVKTRMKQIHDTLADLLVVKWNFDNRNVLYRNVLEKWDDKQIDMLIEESAELVKRLADITLLISKMRREKRKGTTLHYLELLNEFLHQEEKITNLQDELADTIIMFDEFNPEFMEKVVARIFFKLNRLQKRVQKAEKGEDKQ